MAYADTQTTRTRTAGIAGVVAIHAVIGAGLIAGLAVKDYILEEPEPFAATDVTLPLPPPPTDPATPETTPLEPATPDIFVPTPPLTFDRPIPSVPSLDLPTDSDLLSRLPSRMDDLVIAPPPASPRPIPKPTATFAPIAAAPSNDPAQWVSTNDYRSSWVRRDLTGTVAFTLSIGRDGRASDCRVTGTSEHSQLDEATCKLAMKRARFTAARDSTGKTVPGSYSNSVRWVLPD